jgi:signal transduction histidine kinase
MPKGGNSQKRSAQAPALSAVAIAALYLIAYWGLDWGSFIFPAKTFDITPWNPPVAASLVLVFLCGWRWSPLLFVAAFTSNLIVRHLATPLIPTLMADAAEAAIYTTAALVMRSSFGVNSNFRSLRDVMVFIGVTVAASGLMAFAYVMIFRRTGFIAHHDMLPLVIEYWVGDVIGLTVIAPAFLTNRRQLLSMQWVKTLLSWEVLAQIGSVVLSLWIMFFWQDPIIGPLFYPLFIPLAWVAARHGLKGITLILLLMQVGLMGTVETLGITVLVATKLQYLMLALCWTGLLLGAVVSERQRAQVSVQRGEARLRSIIELAPDGIVITDEAGNVEMANRLFESIYGARQGNLVGRDITSLIPVTSGRENEEIVLRRADGRGIPAEVSTANLLIADRNTSVITVRDISQRKEAEARLRQHRDAVEQAFRGNLTEGLAAALAHELNQPLSAIASYTGAALRILSASADAPSRAIEQLNKVAAQAKRAGDIIRRLREFFRGAILDMASVEMRDPVRDVLALLSDDVARVRAVIEIDVPGQFSVLGDRLQIEQVLINLIRNSLEAVAEVPEKDRTIRIAAKWSSDNLIEMSVSDTGSGFDPHVSERLFEPFITGSATGMGLGLAISRSIVQAHGGKLWMEPRSPHGAIMRFTLRAAGVAAPSTQIMDRAHG